MSNPAPFEPIAELLERSLSIRHVSRFIHFHRLRSWLGAGAVGLVAGWLLARRR